MEDETVANTATDNVKIFSLNGNQPLAEKIAKAFGQELGKCVVRQFSDGEIAINIEESVRGVDTYLIQSTNQPVNDYYWELLIMIDAMKRASAKSINVVLPYYAYARQDRTARPRTNYCKIDCQYVNQSRGNACSNIRFAHSTSTRFL